MEVTKLLVSIWKQRCETIGQSELEVYNELLRQRC